MTHPNSTAEIRTKVPGFLVFIGVIIGSFFLEQTVLPVMADLLPGRAWHTLCRAVNMLLSAVFWMFIVPDLLHAHFLRKARKADGSHEKM